LWLVKRWFFCLNPLIPLSTGGKGEEEGLAPLKNNYMETLKSGAQKLGLDLSPSQLEQFEVYYRELVDWNKRINLTTITGYEAVQTRHFLDSLSVTAALSPEDIGESLSVIDVGTGAGLPGVPLKIILPGIRLTLLEATAKKAKFLEYLIERLGLGGVEIVVGRAEEGANKPQYREKFDLVLSRAVAALPALVELALPFCTLGGRFVAQKKGDIEVEIKQSHKAIEVMGGRLREIKTVGLEKSGEKRCLIIIDKIKATPAAYPRRPGMPAKRPII
jgi:16S rRNA (guanine527-N7)-methyltransferase